MSDRYGTILGIAKDGLETGMICRPSDKQWAVLEQIAAKAEPSVR
jgi:hypothetical protein